MMKKLAIVLFVLGCKGSKSKLDHAPANEDKSTRAMGRANDDPPPPPEEDSPADESGGTGTAMSLDEGKMGRKDRDRAEGQYKMKSASAAAPAVMPAEPEKAEKKPEAKGTDKKVADGETAGEATATRAWFPETFLFEPLVVTDDSGGATVPVKVPDRLTTWRVLALGHARNGAQGGAVTSFLGTLPAYVDPIVPKALIVGDEVKLPIQLVNTTDKAISSTLSSEATNAMLSGASGPRTLPPQGNLVDYATLVANKPGPASIKVALAGTDAVLRAIEVRPAGKPVLVTRGGTLAQPRELKLNGPMGADPLTDRVHLTAYPGALALLRAELGVSTFRQGVADDAYALLLAGKATALLASMGDKADPDAVRTLSILAGQRAIRDARRLDETSAALLAEAAGAHPDNPVLARLSERAHRFLVDKQKADGTFGGGNGWTLQRVLVATAEAVRASGDAKVKLRAQGAFERNLGRITDPYTAAAILATGAVSGPVADKLVELVTKAVVTGDDGAKYIDPPAQTVRTDGTAPNRAECTALAVLALQGKGPVADLGATLLGTYALDSGWGDGRANLIAMKAVLELFKAPLPDHIAITLQMDGKPIAEGTLEKDRIREVLSLDAAAPGLAGSHTFTVKAEPAVPGLGFSLSLQSYVPWPKEQGAGLELQVATKGNASVGKPYDLALVAVAPAGQPIHIVLALPAGVQSDQPSLQALVDGGTVSRFEAADGKIELFANPLEPGQTFAAKLRVVPTLAGKLHSPPSTIEAEGQQYVVPPSLWEIK